MHYLSYSSSVNEEVEICNISDECFEVPSGYRQLRAGGRGTVDQEEELLQMAIQQSLVTSSKPVETDDDPVCSHVMW